MGRDPRVTSAGGAKSGSGRARDPTPRIMRPSLETLDLGLNCSASLGVWRSAGPPILRAIEGWSRKVTTMDTIATMTQQAGHARATAQFATDEARWEAVRRRDPAADGQFLYSVATTGVFCRPSCAARPARRENVAFHASPAEAERAGFRPCKRCRPDLAPRAERSADDRPRLPGHRDRRGAAVA